MKSMRTAGVRKARQELTTLLDDVRKGREVIITERGRPVALVKLFVPEPESDALNRALVGAEDVIVSDIRP